MTLLTLFGLSGFFLGTVLHFLLMTVVLRRRSRRRLERMLVALLAGLFVWYLGNLLGLILRQMDLQRVSAALVGVDIAAFLGLSFLPALLAHTHWLYYREFFTTERWEKNATVAALVALYLPLVFLPEAVNQLSRAPGVPPLAKLGPLQPGFLVLLATAYFLSAGIQVRVLQRSRDRVERQVFRRLLPFFVGIPIFTFAVFGWQPVPSESSGSLLVLLAQMASLAPTFIVAYYMYRHQFLEITVQRSIASALVILVTLAIYLAGIRRLVTYLEQEFAAPPLLIEGVLLAAVLLLFHPLGRWMESWVGRLLRGELRRYRALAEEIRRESYRALSPVRLKQLIEALLERELPVSKVEIHLDSSDSGKLSRGSCYPLRSGSRQLGVMEVRLLEDRYGTGHREALRSLSAVVANALEHSRMLEEQMRMERELAAKSHLENLGQMAASIAHNVKNPLSSMKTLLQLRAERTRHDQEQRDEISMMIKEIDRLSKTVTALLRFSRLESDRKDSGGKGIRVRQVLERIRDVFGGDLTSRNIEMKLEVDDSLPLLAVRTDALNDILSNLVSNAIEASPSDSRVTLAASSSGGHLQLSVEDQGAGIPDAVGQRLFDPFVTTKSQGTGLGLAIVKRRVDQLGGTIQVGRGTKSRGTRFVIRIPLDGDLALSSPGIQAEEHRR